MVRREGLLSLVSASFSEENLNLKLGGVACGPESLLYDVRNAVADCQLAIADGFGSARDIYLHTENFGCVASLPRCCKLFAHVQCRW